MKKLALFGMTLALALPFVTARPAAAAATQVKVIAQATGDKDPFTLTWIDDAKGNTKIDDQLSGMTHDTFAGLQFIFTDSQQLVLGKVSGGNLRTVLQPAYAVDVNDGKGYYVIHMRSQGMSLDGVVYRFSDQPDQGLARLTLILLDSKGNSASTY